MKPSSRNYFSNLPSKKSYGIALFNYNTKTNSLEMVMVKKRVSFYFVEFVMRPQNRREEERLIHMLNNMTSDEKLDILSLDFSRMYYRIWFSNPEKLDSNVSAERTEKYYYLKSNFEKNFLVDRGEKLRELIDRSQNIESLWEIPKGRKNNPQEKDMNCAIREFEEETNIPPDDYQILDEKPMVFSYCNARVKYINVYYIALLKNDRWLNPRCLKINYKNAQQLSEISDIRWMDINQLRAVDISGRFVPEMMRYDKILRRRYKIHKLAHLKML
jgi:8-oxo-dGTP pyrophosphatase MutT (NUDIX family)